MVNNQEVEFEIIDMFELRGTLVVITECEYGKDKFGLSLDAVHVDPATNEPRLLPEIREKLANKYLNNTRKVVEKFKNLKGKKFKVIKNG